MNASSASEPDSVDRLAEEFVARYRRGEHPDLAEYAERFPQHAAAIRDLFPALALIERVKPGAGDPTGTCAGAAGHQGGRPERLGDFRIHRHPHRAEDLEAIERGTGHIGHFLEPAAAMIGIASDGTWLTSKDSPSPPR